MKKLVATAPRTAALVEYTDPVIKENEIKAEVIFASPKHGTEIVDFRGLSPFAEEEYNAEWQMFMPREEGTKSGLEFGDMNLGNMWVGKVTECGSAVTEFAIGDIVCSYGSIRQTQIINAVNNYKLRKVTPGVSYKNAVCYDPAQFALGGVRDANVRAGDYVAVIGLGAIGQIAVQLAKRAGASIVIAIDPIQDRCDIALSHGADVTLDPTKCDVGLELKKLTGKKGVDSVIETSGHVTALQASLKGLAYGGTISYIAFGKPFPEGLNFGREAHFNNAKLIFSRASSEPNPDYPRWDRKRIEETCWELLMNGYLNCEDIIYPVVSFEESAAAFEKYVDRNPELGIKMGVQF
ncbi:zinc-binding alcohol dehydrogenase [Paenibacillus sp. OV219]|uniref:zinc-dependent alcohol dehydrogenase n=1 Tax=Paenibacillus sp. OV219 TaxID=1884377 RepID=UPI0008CE4F76|nr:zinc-binding alcohol dehydrogenase [Paenibacillus sp. OV219]SEO12425.1 Threonine dehydrogenase [Paenibacillus sp. OV219]